MSAAAVPIPGRLATPLQLTHKSISTINAEYLTGLRLDLSPSYQRARCWTQAQNNGLINSIMLNWPTPLLTFYKLHPTHPDDAAAYAAGRRYECVDGQNRLSAIRAFLSGRPIHNEKNGKEETVTYMGRHWGSMPEEHQELFGEYVMAITIIQEPMTLTDRKAMFTRLQDGTKISGAEYLKNVEHPVSQFISRTGLRDRFKPVITGFMTGAKGEWLDVLVDCVTLWIRRDTEAPLEFLRRTQADLRAELKKSKSPSADSPYYMPLSEVDYAPLTVLFDQLIGLLTATKADKKKCHKFHVTMLFYHLMTAPVPSTAAPSLSHWFDSTYKPVILDKINGTMAADADIRAELLALLGTADAAAAAAESDSESTKPKRRAIPKAKRVALWIRDFGALETAGTCLCCQTGITYGGKWEQAHVLAVVNKGTNDLGNLRPTCVSCNRSCGTENLEDWCRREYPDAPLLKS